MGAKIDLTGQRFGRLVVLERRPQPYKATRYLCQCDCGNQKEIIGTQLTTGKTKSCGCYRKENTSKFNKSTKHKNLTGQVFGKLTALEETADRDSGCVVWKCLCECGKIHYVRGSLLSQGLVQSCGCGRSKGEDLIVKLLTEAHISFEQQKNFASCRSPKTNFVYYFDFYLPDYNTLIEFDGIQHFETIDFFGEELEERQQADAFKNNWCKENNIPLIRIPYTHLKELKIEDLILETSKFII